MAHVRMASSRRSGHTVHMLDARHFKAQDLRGLSPDALAAVAEQMLQRIAEQGKLLDERDKHIGERFIPGRSRHRPAHHVKPHPSAAYKG